MEGYTPETSDFALNVANTVLQIATESLLGVGSPRFLHGASRGFIKEGLGGALQEGVQGMIHDLNEVLKGNAELQDMVENADQYLRDAIIGGLLQGAMGGATYGAARRRADNMLALARAKSKGREVPNAEDKQLAKAYNDATESGYANAMTQEWKNLFDAQSGEGKLHDRILTALKQATDKHEDWADLDETERAQRLEQIAQQETLRAVSDSVEQKKSISEHALNNITYKDGAIWLEGTEPEVGDKSVSYARVLAERQLTEQPAKPAEVQTIEQRLQKAEKPAVKKSVKEVRQPAQQVAKPEESEGILYQSTAEQQQVAMADENARLDDIYPEYTGETINIGGTERSVYNADGNRIAKSAEALRNFYNWFGNSKVVDEQGRPLVVYHGSDVSGIEVFDNQANQTKQRQIGAEEGYFFTDSEKVARRFVPVRPKTKPDLTSQKVSAFGSVEAYEDFGRRMRANAKNLREELGDSRFESLRESYFDISAAESGKDFLYDPQAYGLYKVYLRMEDISEYDGEIIGVGEDRRTMLRSAKGNGKDGVIIYSADTGAGIANEYIVFEPNQIKSVDNRGTYSPTTGNILRQGSIKGKGDQYRGSYDEQLKRIVLGEKSDLTTIQHEFAHYWIQNNFKWARSGQASKEWLDNWNKVEDWLGIERKDRFLSREASERFAKAYERFIMEGQVVPELQWAYDGFSKFYNEVYDELQNEYFDLQEELSPDIINWFNAISGTKPIEQLQKTTKAIQETIVAQGGAVIEKTGDVITETQLNDKGEVEVTVAVPQSDIKQGDNLLVYSDKTTASKLQESARKKFGDSVEVQQLATLDTEATLKNFQDWIARDRDGAWNALNDPATSEIYKAYLYKAFAGEALENPALASDLANMQMAQQARQLGQALQALNLKNESGFDIMQLVNNIERAKGKMSVEELNNALEEIGVSLVELDSADESALINETECAL